MTLLAVPLLAACEEPTPGPKGPLREIKVAYDPNKARSSRIC